MKNNETKNKKSVRFGILDAVIILVILIAVCTFACGLTTVIASMLAGSRYVSSHSGCASIALMVVVGIFART